MKYPAHSDPRAYQYFSCGFVGKGHGDIADHECAEDRENGTACSQCVRGGSACGEYSTNFDNMCGLSSTATIDTSYAHYCAYCGNRAHTLQARNYKVVGYTCSCAGACDEREWVIKWNAMADRHSDEEVALKKQAPKQDKAVLVKVFQRSTQRILKEIEGGSVPHVLERMGILVVDPNN